MSQIDTATPATVGVDRPQAPLAQISLLQELASRLAQADARFDCDLHVTYLSEPILVIQAPDQTGILATYVATPGDAALRLEALVDDAHLLLECEAPIERLVARLAGSLPR